MDQGSNWAQEHPHAAYKIRMGVIERQNRTHRAMRQYCPKREVKDIDRDPDTLDEGNKGCQCCWKSHGARISILLCQQRLTGLSIREECYELLLSEMQF